MYPELWVKLIVLHEPIMFVLRYALAIKVVCSLDDSSVVAAVTKGCDNTHNEHQRQNKCDCFRNVWLTPLNMSE